MGPTVFSRYHISGLCLTCLLLCLFGLPVYAEQDDFPDDPDAISFSDEPMYRDVEHPAWFKLSFLNLPDDVNEAARSGKRGLVVYFGQKHCAYCDRLMEVNFGMADIVEYTRKHFDIVPIDIWSDREVVDTQGNTLSEKQFAEREKTNFTPSMIFYDLTGREVFRLRGYYPPYQFRAALEYVADRHYEHEDFRSYLERGNVGLAFSTEEMIEEELFAPEPYMLDRSRFRSNQPLVVFFEQGDCYACEVLHGEQIARAEITRRLNKFDAVQLNIWGDTRVVTPAGNKTTAREWAREMGIFYTPTIVFFDQSGFEVFRIDSIVRFHRLANIMDFISSGDYRMQPYYQRWSEVRNRDINIQPFR